MSIIFDEQTKVFLLSTNTTSYAFCKVGCGLLQHLYYGAKIDDTDLKYIVEKRNIAFSAKAPYLTDDVANLDTMPNEYSFYGDGDYRTCSGHFAYEDGSRLSSFKYVSHKILKEQPLIEEMPTTSGGETLYITLFDEYRKVTLHLFYNVFEKEDCITRRVEVINNSKTEVRIEKLASLCVDFYDNDFDILSLYGRHAMERQIQRTPLMFGKQEISSCRGSSSHQLNPFVALLRKDATETSGEVYGFNLVYSGSFSIETDVSQLSYTRLVAGINAFDFEWLLKPDEKFCSPECVMTYSSEGLSAMSHHFHDLYRERLINKKYVYAKRPIVLNNWEYTAFDFNEEKLCNLIKSSLGTGIDTFVLDDGWFGARNNDKAGLGDWVVNTKKLPHGLNKVIETCKECGLKFGLWFEPEMVNPDSDLYRAHPEYVLRQKDITPSMHRNQMVLDIINPKVFDYVVNAVSLILENNDISYVKWDMNRNITENCSLYLPKERQKETQHRYVLAFYKMAKTLTEKFPNVFFEGCSGGGGRLDPAILHYFAQNWCSDNTDAFARTKIQYGTSLCYPLSAVTGHVSKSPNNATKRATDFSARGDIASLCPTGYELNLLDLPKEDYAAIEGQTKRYKRNEETMLKGDVYRLFDPFTSNLFGIEVVSKDKLRAYAVFMQQQCEQNGFRGVIKFKGLNEKAIYNVSLLDKKMSGETLMNVGLLFPDLRGDYKTFTIELNGEII